MRTKSGKKKRNEIKYWEVKLKGKKIKKIIKKQQSREWASYSI
jgi:hypothetical protein